MENVVIAYTDGSRELLGSLRERRGGGLERTNQMGNAHLMISQRAM